MLLSENKQQQEGVEQMSTMMMGRMMPLRRLVFSSDQECRHHHHHHHRRHRRSLLLLVLVSCSLHNFFFFVFFSLFHGCSAYQLPQHGATPAWRRRCLYREHAQQPHPVNLWFQWVADRHQNLGAVVTTTTTKTTTTIILRAGAAKPLHSQQNNNNNNNDADNDLLKGAAVRLHDVSVYRGSSRILRDISWRIEPRTKWALVGANGSGKSTLLKAIVGEIGHDQGRIVTSIKSGGPNKNADHQKTLGYLQQTAVAGSTLSIYEEAASGMTRINEARRDMERATRRLMEAGEDNHGDDMLDLLERATARFEAVGGHQQEQKVATVLKGLGFSKHDIHGKTCDQLSGGWQMRVAFAKLLLSEPTLCLMDEPSNHLLRIRTTFKTIDLFVRDAAAKKWLTQYLAAYQGDGAMVLVTHDVNLLQSMDHIAELIPSSSGSSSDGGGATIQIYKSCNYNQYLQLKEQRAAAAVAEYERNAEKAAKLQSFVDRFGASATKASAAQSRVKMIERMQRDGLLDAPHAQAVTAQRFKPSLMFPDPPKTMGASLLSLHQASVGYDSKIPPLVSDIRLNIQRGMKLLIRGPNGSGKSTVLHSLLGTLPLLQGERRENELLRLSFFTQDLAQELDPEQRAVDVATSYARGGEHGDVFISDQDARGALGRLGLQGEKALRKIKDLSGGEKARVALAMFSLKPSNLYLLDEVSNHLDTECAEALSQALCHWGGDRGAVVVVSHDRDFCSKIEFTHVASVNDGKLTMEARSARESDWVIESLGAAQPTAHGDTGSDTTITSTEPQHMQEEMDARLRKKAFNAPKRIRKLEELVEDAEMKVAALDDEMLLVGTDVGRLVDMTNQKELLQATIAEYMDEWEELEELLSHFEAVTAG